MAKSRDKKGQQDYHHGDLKRALLDEALKMVAEEGEEALSLRELARRVGVSHTAPYRHFPDKKALLKAMAEDGFRELLKSMNAAAAGDKDAVARFQEIGWSYVKFALANPERINVMFGPELAPRNNDGCRLEIGEETFFFVTKAIDAAKGEGKIGEGDTMLQAVASWALVHGLATLLTNGRLYDEKLINLPPEKLVKAIMWILVAGLAKR